MKIKCIVSFLFIISFNISLAEQRQLTRKEVLTPTYCQLKEVQTSSRNLCEMELCKLDLKCINVESTELPRVNFALCRQQSCSQMRSDFMGRNKDKNILDFLIENKCFINNHLSENSNISFRLDENNTNYRGPYDKKIYESTALRSKLQINLARLKEGTLNFPEFTNLSNSLEKGGIDSEVIKNYRAEIKKVTLKGIDEAIEYNGEVARINKENYAEEQFNKIDQDYFDLDPIGASIGVILKQYSRNVNLRGEMRESQFAVDTLSESWATFMNSTVLFASTEQTHFSWPNLYNRSVSRCDVTVDQFAPNTRPRYNKSGKHYLNCFKHRPMAEEDFCKIYNLQGIFNTIDGTANYERY